MSDQYDPESHHRRSIRLATYDYTLGGAYFITICTLGRRCILGEVVDGEMQCSRYGRVVVECWEAIPNHFSTVDIDAFVVMPNHVHGIIVISRDSDVAENNEHSGDPNRAQHAAPLQQLSRRASAGSLSAVVRSFKAASSKRINEMRGTLGEPVWQRNYYERVVRNERELNAIREYIANNPANWAQDKENQ